ncbi:NAD(P)H nitroreductase [[Haemophilus] ducreyi]|nr:NAD(P)H nitroreductase [[Haemophilus] ducreyi]
MQYILELARLSPSSVGSEPWKFIVLQNPTIRAKIAPFSWGIKHPMDEMSHLVIILAKKMPAMIVIFSVHH